MNSLLAASDRAAAVRREIERWIRGDLVAKEQRGAARELAPVEATRPSRAFQLLGMLFGGVAITAATSLYFLVVSPDGIHFLAVIGLALLVAVEWRSRVLHHVAAGPEIAGAFLGVGLLLAGLVQILDDSFSFSSNGVLRPLFAIGALLWGGLAWRWGLWLFGGLSVLFLFLFIGQWPLARVSWLVAGIGLSFLLSRLSHVDRPPGLAPSQRRAALAGLVVALAALYLSVHWTGYRLALIERFSSSGGDFDVLPWFRPVSLVGTAVVPLALAWFGIRARRRVLLNAGTLLAAVSIATLHWHLELVPHWAILIAGGAAFLALGLWLRRWLDAAPEQHRHGFTSEPMLEDSGESSDLETAVSMGAMTPEAARPERAPAEPTFEGGGGRSGGGGASEGW